MSKFVKTATDKLKNKNGYSDTAFLMVFGTVGMVATIFLCGAEDPRFNAKEDTAAATMAVKYAKGEIESNSSVSPTLISDTQAYLAKLNYDKSIIVQEISVSGGNVKVSVAESGDIKATKSETTSYTGKDVDLK